MFNPSRDQVRHFFFDAWRKYREREVLVQMARGLDNGQIARDLFVSEATVRTHVGHVLSKLNARSRVQAVVVAYESGLMRPNTA